MRLKVLAIIIIGLILFAIFSSLPPALPLPELHIAWLRSCPGTAFLMLTIYGMFRWVVGGYWKADK